MADEKLAELLPVLEFKLLTDVNLSASTENFQIDCLLATSRCMIILESKNIRGQLAFNEKTGGFTRTDDDGVTTVLANPIYQLQKNSRFLTHWLTAHHFRIPVTGSVVMTSPKAWLLNVPAQYDVIKLQQVPDLVLRKFQAAPKQQLPASQFEQLLETLQASNDPFIHSRLCERFDITFEDLRTGIRCLSCGTLSIRRQKRNWRCSACGFSDPLMHIDALQEYVTLTEAPLTNRRLRTFWEIESPDVAYRVLKSLDTEKRNKFRHQEYILTAPKQSEKH